MLASVSAMSLTSQLLFIAQLHTQGATGQAAALEELYVQSHGDSAQAWSDLAWPHLQAQRWAAARANLLKAYGLNPQCLSALDGLAQVHACLGDVQAACQYGLAALDAKDALGQSGAASALPSALPMPATEKGLRVLSFSLFGQDAFYSECAVRNAELAQRIYPGWQTRFYLGEEVSPFVRERLRATGAELIAPTSEQRQLPGTVWRFLALDDPQVATVACRDADSLLGTREATAVQAWLASGCSAHVMRDDFLHTDLILAGMWGAHAQPLRGIQAALQTYFSQTRHATHGDQHFLRDWVWPRVRASVLQHDRCYRWRGAQDFSEPLAAPALAVGASVHDEVLLNFASKAEQLPYRLLLQGAGTSPKVLGRYIAKRQTQGFIVRLPAGYQAQLAGATLAMELDTREA
jgi:hypothetical protein